MTEEIKDKIIVIATAPLPYRDNRSSSLGLGLLYSSLKNKGFKNVLVIDAAFEGNQISEIIQIIKNKTAKISFLGLSVLPASLQSSRELLKKIRSEFGYQTEICLGGYLPTSFGEKTFDFFKESNPDYVVMGRGEYAIIDILKSGKAKPIPNVIINNSNSFVSGGRSPLNFSASPWPDRLNNKTDSSRTAQVYRLVGCPGNCNFCNIHLYAQDAKENLVQRTAADFAAEIEYLFKTSKKDCFDILDEDALGKNPEEWWDILNEFKKRGLKNKIKFWILGRIPSIAQNEKLISAMADYGLISCYCGLESWNERQLKTYNKVPKKDIPNFIKQAIKTKKIFEKCRIIPKYGFIPLDAESTLEEYAQNISTLVNKKFLYYVSELTKRLAIYENSKIELIYKRKNLLLKKNIKGIDQDWITNRYNYIFTDPRIQTLSHIFDIWTKGIIQNSINIKKAMRERLENSHSQKSQKTWRLFKALRDKELEMALEAICSIQNGENIKNIACKVTNHIVQYNAIASK